MRNLAAALSGTGGKHAVLAGRHPPQIFGTISVFMFHRPFVVLNYIHPVGLIDPSTAVPAKLFRPRHHPPTVAKVAWAA